MTTAPPTPHRLIRISAGLLHTGLPSQPGPSMPTRDNTKLMTPARGLNIHSQTRDVATTGVMLGR